MKKLTLLQLLLLSNICLYATVRTVSSNPSNLGQFSTIQAAIDVSADSDSVYVYGSPNVYAGFTILDKKITVIGPGWAPDKNLPLQAVVSGATIRNSAGGGSPDGSELQGLVLVGAVYLSRNTGADLTTANLRLVRCQFNASLEFELDSNGFLFEGCVFYGVLNFNSGRTYQNYLFQNNIFFVNIGATYAIQQLTNSINIRFDHNLFASNNNSGGSAAFIFLNNCRFISLSNNIFNQANAGNNLTSSTFNNNITNNASLNISNITTNATPWSVNSNVDGGGNVSNQSPQMTDQATINAASNSATQNFTISAGPANNSGSDGKDMGLLYDATGSLNWANSSNSRLPRIFSMNITTPTITPGGTLSVTVDARKSN